MKIYFEDGYLLESQEITKQIPYSQQDGLCVVRAERGISQCVAELENLLKHYNESTVYTNFTGAIDNKYVWNTDLKIPELFIRDIHGKWTSIVNLTTRELRSSHNLYKLYVAGEFSDNNSVNDNSVIVVSQERNGWAWSVDIIMSKLASYTEGGKAFKTPIHKCFKSGFELSYAGACAAAEKCHREYLISRGM